MIIAAIDVGTNTVLMLVARAENDEPLVVLEDLHRVPRLGAGVDARKTFNPGSVARMLAVLDEYRVLSAAHAPDRIVVCGTSAVRDAADRNGLIAEVRRRTGFALEVLSGEEEAFWSFQGACSGLPCHNRLVVVDIGGGSTEVILGDATGIDHRVSMDIGAVRLTERCFRHDPPLDAEIAAAGGLIDRALEAAADISPSGTQLVGVAGTSTTLATLAQGLMSFSQQAVAGYLLQRMDIERLWDQLRRLPSAGIARLSDVLHGRADIILAGTLILRKVMDRYGFDAVTVSERGLRYGLVLRELRRAAAAHEGGGGN
jgi:exopolyphosphatase/guanosine-5'-triphosphate,3'-diphosphate pyrophosphatase